MKRAWERGMGAWKLWRKWWGGAGTGVEDRRRERDGEGVVSMNGRRGDRLEMS